MSWAIDARALNNLRSFECCERYAASMRAALTERRKSFWNENVLPLSPYTGGWQKKHFRLEWHEADGTDGPYWACVLHRTDIVRYHPGGAVSVNLTHDSVSTRMFFDVVRPGWMRCLQVKGYVFLRIDSYSVRAPQFHVASRRAESFIRISPEHVVLNPEDFVYHKRVADREKRAKLKPLLAPLLEWYDALTACGQSVITVCAGAEYSATGAVFDAILDGVAGEGDWRALCARLHRNRFPGWQAAWLTHEAKFGPQHIGPLRRLILESFWQHTNAFTTVRTIVPAGEAP